MNTQEKLRIIQRLSERTQTQLAATIGVSFVAFNNWWTGKSQPRARHAERIDALYREYTGQKEIPEDMLSAKKDLLVRRSKKYQDVLGKILKNPDISDQFLLSLTYHSNKIEGSTLSEDETADILFRNRSIPDKSIIEQLEARNHQAALQYLFAYLKNGKNINEELILKLHSILMNSIRDDAGRYRNHGVRIVGSNVPTANYLKVPVLMRGIAKDISRKHGDILRLVSRIHARFEQIHPFSDGNGRVGRLILTAMLLQGNLAPAVIRQEEKRVYYACLRRAQLKDDSTQLEDFVCDAVSVGFEILERK